MGVQPGMIITINGKAHRVVAVRSPTQLEIDRPWWLPITGLWYFILGWVRARLGWFWFRLRHGWDDED